MTNLKTCTKCNEAKAFDMFYRDNRRDGGRKAKCKVCCNEMHSDYVKANVEVIVAYQNAYNKELRGSLTLVEKAAHGSVSYARSSSCLSSADLYGGLTHAGAVAATIPLVEERLKREAATGIPHHIDHIVSLANGGTHTTKNLQILTAEANRTKG